MQTQDIQKSLREARDVLEQSKSNGGVHNKPPSKKSVEDYYKVVARIFGVMPNSKDTPPAPTDADAVIQIVRQAKKLSTLRKMARAVRFVAIQILNDLVTSANQAEKAGSWNEVEKYVTHQSFETLLTLAKMLPADYKQIWKAQANRKGKKVSLRYLPDNWREQMAKAAPEGQFRLPMLVAFMTGARPAELEKGVILKRDGTKLVAYISGVKVTEHAGQEYRLLKISEHPIKDMILDYMDSQDNKNELVVRVGKGNSLTTYMRALGKKIWPRRKEAITVYTARHAMAADCKKASAEGGDEDLASKVLGHRVDKTRSYYGNISQSGDINIVPSKVKVPHSIKNTSKAINRPTPSQLAKARSGIGLS